MKSEARNRRRRPEIKGKERTSSYRNTLSQKQLKKSWSSWSADQNADNGVNGYILKCKNKKGKKGKEISVEDKLTEAAKDEVLSHVHISSVTCMQWILLTPSTIGVLPSFESKLGSRVHMHADWILNHLWRNKQAGKQGAHADWNHQ